MRPVPPEEIRFRLKLAVQALAKKRRILTDLTGAADRQVMAQQLAVDVLFEHLAKYSFTAPEPERRIGDRMMGEED